MILSAKIIVGLVALLHAYFFWFEFFAWESRGPKIFESFPKDLFAPTKAMAANQGLYNLFLVAGLIWSLIIPDPLWQRNVAIFFLGCVAVAGIYGAYSVSRRILYVQAIPALVGLALILVF